MKYKDENGNWKELSVKTSDTLPIGSIIPYTSKTTPINWLPCNGQAISRTDYADLFAIIGTQYGAGNGSTTFNVPDLNDYKVPIGYDRFEEQSERMNLGTTGGEETHKLTVNEMPSHNHTLKTRLDATGFSYLPQATRGDSGGTVEDTTTGIVNNTGGSQAHNNMQPYVTTNYIIKAKQSIGVVGNVVNEKTTSDKDTYSCDYINNQLLNIEKGSVTVSTENTDYVEVAVTFNKTFNSKPTIILTPESAGIGFNAPTVAIKKNSISTTGFTMIYTSGYTSGYSSGYNNKVYYLAIE